MRGPGLVQGLRVLDKVKQETGLPVLTDIHGSIRPGRQARWSTSCRSAFLSRQTDLIVAAARRAAR